MRVLALLLATVLVLTGCSASDPDTGTQNETNRLPDVTLEPLGEGDAVDLGELKGPTVVNLWASWCGPCKRELPVYQSFAQKHAGKVDVLGVDWQETQEDAARDLARESGVTYPLVVDPEGRLRTQVLPKVVLVDADGTVAFEKYVEIKSVAQLEGLAEKHLKVTP